MIRRLLLYLSVGLALASAARAAEPSTTDQLMAVDRAFAADAARLGTPEAFRAYMDTTDSREFDGGDPVRGADAIFLAQGGGKPATGTLSWEPVEAFGAKGGDMGVTWGRWTYTSNDARKKPVTGRYVTVWRRDAQGQWKGLIDIGNPD